eukprot:scaffold71725_cov84-Phaeocystis_antarctica.AAC.9
MIVAVLTPVVAALNLGSALVQSNRPTGVQRGSLVHMATGLNPSSQDDRAAVAARAAAARYPVPPVYGASGSGGAMTDAEAKRKWAADRSAQQRSAQRGSEPRGDRAAKATAGLRREYTASIGAGTIYSPPGSGGGMSDAEAKQAWSAQRSATQRNAARAARQVAPAAPAAAPDAADSADFEPDADDFAADDPAAPAAVAPAAAAAEYQSTTHAAKARARPSLYPTQSIYAPPGAGGAMTDAEAKRKYTALRSADQRRAERAERDGPRSTSY